MSGKKSSTKGSTFERTVCKALSLAYTNGKNDNVFWRTAGSGARGTFRRKTGASCYNVGGDIGFLDPIGQPLLEKYYFELKCGYSHWDLLNWLLDLKQKDLSDTINKLCDEAGEKMPVLILKQTRQEPLVVIIGHETERGITIFRKTVPRVIDILPLTLFCKTITEDYANAD